MIVGALVFVVFALVLESLLHRVVIPHIISIPWLYVLYGAFAAALFEETGRFLAFRFILKDDRSPVLYGIGHGGIESYLLLGLPLLSTLIMYLMEKSGHALTEAQAQAVMQVFASSPSVYLLGGAERVISICLQIALSVFVCKSVTTGKARWYFIAFFCHFLTDLFAMLYQIHVLTNLVVVEILLGMSTLAVCAFAYKEK